MELKNVTFYYTPAPTPSCDSHCCQDTIRSDAAPSCDSGVSVANESN